MVIVHVFKYALVAKLYVDAPCIVHPEYNVDALRHGCVEPSSTPTQLQLWLLDFNRCFSSSLFSP